MAKLGKAALSALLGGISGGAKGYDAQKNKMKEFAIQELNARPSLQKNLEYVESLGGEKMSPKARQDTAITLGTGGLITETPGGGYKKKPTPRQTTPKEVQRQRWITSKTKQYMEDDKTLTPEKAEEKAIAAASMLNL